MKILENSWKDEKGLPPWRGYSSLLLHGEEEMELGVRGKKKKKKKDTEESGEVAFQPDPTILALTVLLLKLGIWCNSGPP